MSDAEPQKPESELRSEFKNLGDSLLKVLRTAWERPERSRLQNEVEAGLNELGHSLRKLTTEFSESEVGQKLKAEADDIRQKVNPEDLEANLRTDIQSVLKRVNQELESLSERMAESATQAAAPEDAPPEEPSGDAHG
jgi:ElaB/YqjD/DUF883 family membrane-anchored ribosome-binding protein